MKPETLNVFPKRASGVLLHPTSLPGPYGVGDLGPAAYAWVESLARARQSWWQVLPLGPTGYGDSPYQATCSFAGNPYLISPDFLVLDGLIRHEDIVNIRVPAGPVNYDAALHIKMGLTSLAWTNFKSGAAAKLKANFDAFCHEQADWLDDFALFMALKGAHGGKYWPEWEPKFVYREPALSRKHGATHGDAVGLEQFRQFLFFRQWTALREHCHLRGVHIIGDLPIFVSGDSSDVWANADLFHLNEQRRPSHVAGVPPDYFSADGQLWGNPLYNWDAMKPTGYAWWVGRMRATLRQVDVVRLDHFRGFEAYWEVPAEAKTAVAGRWVPGPGADLFHVFRDKLGGLPVIAEDLGLITPAVEASREQFQLPGMRVLQFAFSDPKNIYLPHHYEPNTVVYTGTHDNDTTRGWFAAMDPKEKAFLQRYAPYIGADISWDLIRLAWSSVANLAVAPLQDVLSLDAHARMNTPGQAADNWTWRFAEGDLAEPLLHRLAELTELYSRVGAG